MDESQKRDVDYGEKNKVTVSNDFIKADYPKGITAMDLKLMRFVISQCRKGDTAFYEYQFSVTDIADRFHIDRMNMYRWAHASVRRLFNCNLEIGTKQDYELLHIFRTAKYKAGTFTMQLDEKTEKKFLQLRRDFTSIPLLPVLAMKGKNSIRIYEVLCEKLMGNMPYADTAMSIYVSLEELRQITETEDKKSYDHLSHFKNKIILPSVNEIEIGADWKVIINDVKRGKKVIGINFEIWSRPSWEYIQDCKEKGILPNRGKYGNDEEQVPGQMTFADYFKE
jgi:plasmid replication initiation protein